MKVKLVFLLETITELTFYEVNSRRLSSHYERGVIMTDLTVKTKLYIICSGMSAGFKPGMLVVNCALKNYYQNILLSVLQ